jgi:hypothetical protein
MEVCDELQTNENYVGKNGGRQPRELYKGNNSFEKGINDMQALDRLYVNYMENDNMSLLNDEFDYMIDEIKENGQIKENDAVERENDDLINIVGNVVGEVDVVERQNKNGENFKVVNFSVVSKDEEANKVYYNCSAYGDKGDIPQEFKKGDFVKLFGQLRTFVDDNGKEHSNVRILSSKLLKAKEQMKGSGERNDKTENDIKALKNAIEERKADLYYADSFEQSAQIREDIENMEKKLAFLEQKLSTGQGKTKDKSLINSEYRNTTKESVLGAINKYKAEDKEKARDSRKSNRQNER